MKKKQQNPSPIIIHKPNKKAATPELSVYAITQFPPKIPEDLAQLDRVILLLGSRKKAELLSQTQKELQEFIGTYPTIEEAQVWKQALQHLRKERMEKAESYSSPKPSMYLEIESEKEVTKTVAPIDEKPERSKTRSEVRRLTPEQIAWIDAHWENACKHESGLYPGSILIDLAKQEGLLLPYQQVNYIVAAYLTPLAQQVKKLQ